MSWRAKFPTVASMCAILLLSLSTPASAASKTGNPYIVASTPTSITLDWPGGTSKTKYRVYYSTSYSGVTSAKAKYKKFTGSKGTIKGLKPNTMYCFQAANSKGSKRSNRYCHTTMRTVNNPSAHAVSIASFNVCGYSQKSCLNHSPWSSAREQRILDYIKLANADVVAVQEAYSRVARLKTILAPHGYAIAADSGTEAVFYRTSKLEEVFTIESEKYWSWVTIPHPDLEVTSNWDTSEESYFDGEFFWSWNTSSSVWERSVEGWVEYESEVPVNGKFTLVNNHATAAWATLKLKSNGKTYTFVSAHLSTGKSASADRARTTETRSLIQQTEALATGRRAIYAGDFNSNRSRETDAPRIAFARAGISDAYDRSSSYKNASYNSYNGWQAKPARGIRYGDHVDKIHAPHAYGFSNWQIVARFKSGKYVTPRPSDHNLVRVTAWLK